MKELYKIIELGKEIPSIKEKAERLERSLQSLRDFVLKSEEKLSSTENKNKQEVQ